MNPDRTTPAHTKYDGVDFVPAKHWTVLFGHHFASIAGAAPVVGPIIAISIWGWGPSLIWVVLGTILIGAVHDYCSLMISVRHGGAGITDIAGDTISKKAKLVFLMFVWLTLILIIAVFVSLCAKTFVVKPDIVIPSLGLIPIALIVGYLMYHLKVKQSVVTVGGLLALTGLIVVGKIFPLQIGKHGLLIWAVILLIYSFIASVTPVQRLLQPRDYLSSFLLFFGLLFGYVGLVFFRHAIDLPPVVRHTENVQHLWPFLFVTIACGAISGFHSIVASGTTSKQLANEKNGRMIGYGGMVAEGLLSAMTVVLLMVAFKNNGAILTLLQKGSGPIGVFGYAYGEVTRKILGGYGELFALILLSAFILTTLDTATRLCRYCTQELFKIQSRYISTLIVVVLSGWLALSGTWNQLWPIFGAANQLIAALALIVITSWLLTRKKAVKYTVLPTIFMLVTTIGALVYKIKEFFVTGELLLMSIAVILLGLAIFISVDAAGRMRILLARKKV